MKLVAVLPVLALVAGASLAVPLGHQEPEPLRPQAELAPPQPQPAQQHSQQLVQQQPAADPAVEKDAVTGRGKMKQLGPLLAAGAMKIGMVGVLAFKALALLVGKALLVAKLAFLLAAIIGLKKLFAQDRFVTYEVVAHPHHSHSHIASVEHHAAAPAPHHAGGDSYSSGWGRSIDVSPVPSGDPQQLAYRAHVKQQ